MKMISLIIAAVVGLFCSNPSLQDSVKTGQVHYEYGEPANAMQKNIHDRLQTLETLERLSEFLSPLRLPRPLTLKV
jgi:hypothetical protein